MGNERTSNIIPRPPLSTPSSVDTWEAKHHPSGFHVHGELIYSVPNDAASPLLNPVGGAIVLVDRGNVSLVEKARAVEAAGGLAVVVADDGTCGDEFICGGWLGSRGDGLQLAEKDAPSSWSDVSIPLVMVSAASAARLRAHMGVVDVVMEGLGVQHYVP